MKPTETAAKHTPGPWKATETGGIFSPEPHSSHVASVNQYPNGAESDANARLIAAAPELLAALKSCADFMQAWANNPKHVTQNRINAFNEQAKFARDAIAKAKGQP